MRILLLATHYWQKGGIEVYVRTVEKACRDLGAEVDVLTVASGWTAAQLPSGGVCDARLRLGQKLRFVAQFCRAAMRRYDVVLCAHPHLAPMVQMWRRWGGPPYAVFAYGIEVWNGLPEARRRALAGAERVVTISSYTAERLHTACGIPREKISLLAPTLSSAYLEPLASDEHRRALRQRWVPDGRKAILTVGRQSLAEGYKGADSLIRAMPAIAREAGNVTCFIVGGGDGLDALRRLADEVGVSESVRVVGTVSAKDLLSLYDACDVFVLPSKGEGFGIVLLEAAARGRPSVGLRMGGIVDATADGQTAVLVDGDEPGALARAVAEVLQGRGPEHLYRSAELRRIVVSAFGVEAFRERLAGILKAVFPSFVAPVWPDRGDVNRLSAECDADSSLHL